MNNPFTKRESITLVILVVFMFLIAALIQFTSFEMTEGWEYFFTVFLGFPLGFYIAIDPERIKRNGK
jgi:hypothetical protein